MKRFLSSSFRNRLFVGFLCGSLIPLLVCSALLLQIFRLQMTQDAKDEAQEELADAAQQLDETVELFVHAARAVEADGIIADALESGLADDPVVYNRFLELTGSIRGSACIELYDASGRQLYSTRSLAHSEPLPTHWGLLYAASGRLSPVFRPGDDVSGSDGTCLAGAVPLSGESGGNAGYLLVRFSQSDLDRLMDSAVPSGNDLLLLSSFWRSVYCSQPSLADSLSEELRERLLSGTGLNSGQDEFSYSVVRSAPTGLYIVLRQPKVFTSDTISLVYAISGACALVCIAVSVLLSLTLSRQLSRPVSRLHAAIEEVSSRNNLDVYVQPEHNDELGALAERFNGMLIALKRNQEQLVENQRELNEAQIRMLQAQLNPHFLCNTLDTMKWFGKINKVPEVAVMSTDLADILRFCVSPEEFVPLSRELELIGRYVEIQRIRFSGSFTFRVDVPEELEGALVPKMILQPIVENALLHGLEDVPDGVVEVLARADGELLKICVSDSGHGIPAELEGEYSCRGEERSRGHLGLYNVDTIIRKHYGAGYGLRLENRKDGPGTVVTATLPLVYKEA